MHTSSQTTTIEILRDAPCEISHCRCCSKLEYNRYRRALYDLMPKEELLAGERTSGVQFCPRRPTQLLPGPAKHAFPADFLGLDLRVAIHALFCSHGHGAGNTRLLQGLEHAMIEAGWVGWKTSIRRWRARRRIRAYVETRF